MTDYHSDRTCVSRSSLALFASSRRQYWLQYIKNDWPESKESDALKVGTGTHAFSLKDPLEMSRIVRIPENVANASGKGSKNLKARFRLKSENKGKTLLSPQQFRDCEQLAANLLEVEIAETSEGSSITLGQLVNHPSAKREFEYRWDDILPCRLKADLVIPLPELTICIDLKTARSIDPRSFRSEVKHRRLWLQDSHYSAGLEKAFGNPVKFVFVCVEKSSPFRCDQFELEPETKALAVTGRNQLLASLKECLETGIFVDPKAKGIRAVHLSAEDMGIAAE